MSLAEDQTFLDRLAELVEVRTDRAELRARATDFGGAPGSGIALGVARPASTEQVARILRLCAAHDIPVIPQGGLTGLVSGAASQAGSLLLDFRKMAQIEEIDAEAAVMVVQAGVPLQTIQEAAAAHGLYFPLDIGARGSCQIGGNIATNAGGNRVVRYGMARDLVLGLEVVLADGTVVSSLNRMIKNNAAYDTKHLFIGSEGTLGVITRGVLRLFPAPRTASVALCACADFPQLLKLLSAARAELSGGPSAFEVMWNNFYRVGSRALSGAKPLDEAYPFYALIEWQGSENSEGGPFEGFVERAFEAGLIVDAAIAKSVSEMTRIWAIRDASGELTRLFGKAVNFDISIPIADIEGFVEDCLASLAAAVPGSTTLVFGHLADSNIHLASRGAGDEPPTELIEQTVYACVARWKGSISAEHGIGLTKRKYLSASRNEAEIALMRRIKQALDPADILNRGKVLPDA